MKLLWQYLSFGIYKAPWVYKIKPIINKGIPEPNTLIKTSNEEFKKLWEKYDGININQIKK